MELIQKNCNKIFLADNQAVSYVYEKNMADCLTTAFISIYICNGNNAN